MWVSHCAKPEVGVNKTGKIDAFEQNYRNMVRLHEVQYPRKFMVNAQIVSRVPKIGLLKRPGDFVWQSNAIILKAIM